MPCLKGIEINCRTFKSYIGVGNRYYHGELCGGCGWWTDTELDLDFKARIEYIILKWRVFNAKDRRKMLVLRPGHNDIF